MGVDIIIGKVECTFLSKIILEVESVPEIEFTRTSSKCL